MKRIFFFLLSKLTVILERLERKIHGWVSQLKLVKFIHKSFVRRPSDIFIVTYPRSGTTWMQMILYQLTTDGDMNFFHISEKCPFFEVAYRRQGGFENLSSPRIFKTHLSSKWLPRKWPCKYICVIRDGKDVAVSHFHFSQTHFGFKENFSVYFKKYFMRGNVPGENSWFQYVSEWLDRRNDDNTLYLFYADLLNDLEGCIYKIADFCGLTIDLKRLPQILQRCSFEFMSQHENKFDAATDPDLAILAKTDPYMAMQAKQGNFIRQGRRGGWAEYFGPQQQDAFERKFDRYVAKKINALRPASAPNRSVLDLRR